MGVVKHGAIGQMLTESALDPALAMWCGDVVWLASGGRIGEHQRMIIVHGIIPIKAAQRDKALDLARVMSEATRTEDGCISYEFYVGLRDPNTLILLQEWENMEALAGHPSYRTHEGIPRRTAERVGRAGHDPALRGASGTRTGERTGIATADLSLTPAILIAPLGRGGTGQRRQTARLLRLHRPRNQIDHGVG